MLEVQARLYTGCGPDLEIDLKTGGAFRRVDDRSRGSLAAQAKESPLVKLVEDRLRQVQMARQAGMVGVVEELIVEDSMPAPGAEDLGAINEDAVVASRDVPMDLREIAPAAHRETVKITSLDVVLARLIRTLRPARAAVPAGSEPRQSPVAGRAVIDNVSGSAPGRPSRSPGPAGIAR